MSPIASSGTVSFSDLRTEFVGGTSSISMGDLYRGGSNILAKAGDNPAVNLAASVPASGTIDIGDFHSTAKGFKSTISSSTTNVDANALFGDDYDVNYPKIVDINSGVTIGGSGDDALDIPAGLAGGLTINNAGIVIGSGGASAGAAGGHAINCAASGVTVNNTGQISGGGGAGANGAAGGNGSYSTTSTQTTIMSFGYGYNSIQYNSEGGDYYWRYLGQVMYSPTCVPCYEAGSTFSYGGLMYSYGPWYKVSRTGPVTTTTGTTGGAGGSFGVGAGYNQSATNGTGGASGGTNAGAGSAGTNGGALGTAASNSVNGGNGNVGQGATGTSGGAAGAAVSGTSVTMNNTGTVNGAVA